MHWDQLRPRDIFAAILLVAVLIVGSVVYIKRPFYTPYNLGRDWKCTQVPKGGATCDPVSPINSN